VPDEPMGLRKYAATECLPWVAPRRSMLGARHGADAPAQRLPRRSDP